MTTRPRRSVLYMPGANARAIEKAKTLPCDAVILDLEDSVAPDAKAAARDQVSSAVMAGGFGAREVVVRINALDTPWWEADLTAAAAARPGRHPDPEGLEAGGYPDRRGPHGRARRGSPDPAVGDAGDAARDPQRRSDRRKLGREGETARGLRHGHQRHRQGDPGAASCPDARRCCPGSPTASSPPMPTGSISSTASTTIVRTSKGSAANAPRAATSVSTARR